jgi:uncharacterized protein (TIGR02453 family)
MTRTDGTTAGGVSTFAGFPAEALAFYEGLVADNSKAYWTDHREVYERAVRAPLQHLLDALEPEFGPGRIFRPYRDVRFSADKSPYKTHAAALLHASQGAAPLYVEVSATGLVLGGGYFHMSRDQVARYRAAVQAEATGAELDVLTRALGQRGFTVIGERLQRPPRGVDPGHPRADLLRHTGLAAALTLGVPGWLGTPQCLEEVATGLRAVRPLTEWLERNVGPAEEVDERRSRPGRVSARGGGV